jgi:hypothetical protein
MKASILLFLILLIGMPLIQLVTLLIISTTFNVIYNFLNSLAFKKILLKLFTFTIIYSALITGAAIIILLENAPFNHWGIKILAFASLFYTFYQAKKVVEKNRNKPDEYESKNPFSEKLHKSALHFNSKSFLSTVFAPIFFILFWIFPILIDYTTPSTIRLIMNGLLEIIR